MDAFVDETYNGALGQYFLGAVIVPHDAVTRMIRVTHDLRAGRPPFKWSKGSETSRLSLLDAVIVKGSLSCVGVTGYPAKPRHQNRVRKDLVRRLLIDLSVKGVRRVTFDNRWPEVNADDLRVARDLFVAGDIPGPQAFEVQHLPDEACCLLWAADAICGAMSVEAFGGAMDDRFVARLGPLLTKLP